MEHQQENWVNQPIGLFNLMSGLYVASCYINIYRHNDTVKLGNIIGQPHYKQ